MALVKKPTLERVSPMVRTGVEGGAGESWMYLPDVFYSN